jgi:2-oxoglutarate dehydrogenase complex dehydrogenase (E1) component-like enzyme
MRHVPFWYAYFQPAEAAWQERIERGRGEEISFTKKERRKASELSCRPKGSEILRQYMSTKRFGLDGGES